jgi:CBS domain containing-hemolysin-like protein
MRAPVHLPRSRPLRDALRTLQEQRRAIAIVVDEQDKPIGVVTVKDLIEPLTGELATW